MWSPRREAKDELHLFWETKLHYVQKLDDHRRRELLRVRECNKQHARWIAPFLGRMPPPNGSLTKFMLFETLPVEVRSRILRHVLRMIPTRAPRFEILPSEQTKLTSPHAEFYRATPDLPMIPRRLRMVSRSFTKELEDAIPPSVPSYTTNLSFDPAVLTSIDQRAHAAAQPLYERSRRRGPSTSRVFVLTYAPAGNLRPPQNYASACVLPGFPEDCLPVSPLEWVSFGLAVAVEALLHHSRWYINGGGRVHIRFRDSRGSSDHLELVYADQGCPFESFECVFFSKLDGYNLRGDMRIDLDDSVGEGLHGAFWAVFEKHCEAMLVGLNQIDQTLA